jgi:hypothetical protein
MNLDQDFDEVSLEEGVLYYRGSSSIPQNVQDLCSDFDNEGKSALDLRMLGVYLNRWEGRRVRLARKGESMPKTGIWVDENGNYCSEHYSSKPGLETYGFASFDTPQELFRHLWLRIVKNGIPASLMSKRNVNEKIDFDTMFPPGRGMTMNQILEELKPMLGGEKLAHPSDADLRQEKTIQKLIELGLIGKKTGYSSSDLSIQVVRDITKGGKIKYYFYCSALKRVKELYSDIIAKVAGYSSSDLLGTMFQSSDYEAWTVTNSQRMPINSVNFRTGENILICRLQENEMFSAVFVAIIKRTFKRAKGKTPTEKLVHPGWRSKNPEMIEELNNLLSDYFFSAAEEIDPTVFIDKDLDKSSVLENAQALLIKFLLKNGSMELKQAITGNSSLTKYVELTTKHEDLDALTKRLINVSKSLKYI